MLIEFIISSDQLPQSLYDSVYLIRQQVNLTLCQICSSLDLSLIQRKKFVQ